MPFVASPPSDQVSEDVVTQQQASNQPETTSLASAAISQDSTQCIPDEDEADDYTNALNKLGMQVRSLEGLQQHTPDTHTAHNASKTHPQRDKSVCHGHFSTLVAPIEATLQKVESMLEAEMLKTREKGPQLAAETEEKQPTQDLQVSIGMIKDEKKKNQRLQQLQEEQQRDRIKFEEIQTRLANREKEIAELKKELKVCKKKEENYSLILDEEEIEESVKRCQQIKQLVYKISTIGKEEQRELIKKISQDISCMKKFKRRKSISWKR